MADLLNLNNKKGISDMKKTYMQPTTEVMNVELTQLMAGSLVENGFNMTDDVPTLGTGETSGNLSLDDLNLW